MYTLNVYYSVKMSHYRKTLPPLHFITLPINVSDKVSQIVMTSSVLLGLYQQAGGHLAGQLPGGEGPQQNG